MAAAAVSRTYCYRALRNPAGLGRNLSRRCLLLPYSSTPPTTSAPYSTQQFNQSSVVLDPLPPYIVVKVDTILEVLREVNLREREFLLQQVLNFPLGYQAGGRHRKQGWMKKGSVLIRCFSFMSNPIVFSDLHRESTSDCICFLMISDSNLL